jgi:hypothetical protein
MSAVECDCPIRRDCPEERKILVGVFPKLTKMQQAKMLKYQAHLADLNTLWGTLSDADRDKAMRATPWAVYWFSNDPDVEIPEMVRLPQAA